MKGLYLGATLALLSTTAHASEVDTMFIRAKTGCNVFSSLNGVGDTVAPGVDLGIRLDNGWGISASFFMTLGGDYYSSPAPNLDEWQTTSTFFIALNPSYSFTKSIATMTFGLGIGAYVVQSSGSMAVYTDPYGDGPSTSFSQSYSRFALAPNLTVDFAITSGFFANFGLMYLASAGPAPHLGALLPSAGVGAKF